MYIDRDAVESIFDHHGWQLIGVECVEDKRKYVSAVEAARLGLSDAENTHTAGYSFSFKAFRGSGYHQEIEIFTAYVTASQTEPDMGDDLQCSVLAQLEYQLTP